jgi:hypothetical protein
MSCAFFLSFSFVRSLLIHFLEFEKEKNNKNYIYNNTQHTHFYSREHIDEENKKRKRYFYILLLRLMHVDVLFYFYIILYINLFDRKFILAYIIYNIIIYKTRLHYNSEAQHTHTHNKTKKATTK